MTPTFDWEAQHRAELEAAAREAAQVAWAPYSHFHVGAALLTDDGSVFSGCNVENATYGATVCAERNAVGTMVRAGHRRIRACVVWVQTDLAAMPCGICRQVLAEFGDNIEILALSKGGDEQRTTLDELLPRRFSGADISRPKP